MSRLKITPASVFWPIVVSSGLSFVLYLGRVVSTNSYRYWYLAWNLLLAWLPLLFAFLLVHWLRKEKWLSIKGVALTALWLAFLPNSFYIVTDFIHLVPTSDISLLYDVVMLMTFAWNGLLLGFISVFLIHTELIKRQSKQKIALVLGAVFILSSFAVYLGRFLTWNTWDIVVNPGGILLDVSDRVIHPATYPSTFTTTALFTVTLLTLYYSLYKLVAVIRTYDKN